MARTRFRFWLLFLGGIYLFLFLGIAAVQEAPLYVSAAIAAIPFAVGASMLGACAVIFLSTIGFHELGHYIAGRAVKFQFAAAVVGPLGLRSEKKRVVPFRVRPALLGGYVVMNPPDDHRVLSRFAFFVLGGPIFSVIWMGILFGAWRLSGLPISTSLSSGSPFSELVGQTFLVIASAMAFITLLSTVIPHQTKFGFPSDGLRLLQLVRRDPQARRLMALLTIQRLFLSGVRIRDIPRETIVEATMTRDGSISDLVALTFQWASDLTHDPLATEKTVVDIETLASQLGPSLLAPWRNSVTRIQATQAIYIRHDAESGAKFLGECLVDSPVANSSNAVLATAISALGKDPDLEKKIARAHEAIAEAEAVTNISFDWEKEWLEAMAKGWPETSTNLPNEKWSTSDVDPNE